MHGTYTKELVFLNMYSTSNSFHLVCILLLVNLSCSYSSPCVYAKRLKYGIFSGFMQDQCQTQRLIHTTFSCIAYLRDLLEDSCFEDEMLGNAVIKKLVRTSKSREILDLMEGMYEAIRLKYLSRFEVALYLECGRSGEIHESYSFEVTESEEYDAGMIKKFCLILQGLKPLPPEKYATIKLYYNETVPEDYNPRGYKDGQAHSFHYTNEKMKIESVQRRITPTEIYVRGGYSGSDGIKKDNEKVDCEKEVVQKVEGSTFNVEDNDTPHPPTPTLHTTHTRCSCEQDSDAFDLIQCDECSRWLHTVCCGFFSNSDKRIPKGRYVCGFCSGGVVKKEAVMRKILSVVYNEGLRSKVWLSNRVGLYKMGLESYFRRLVEEGFMKTEGTGSTKKMVVVKNEKIKKKIKGYFRGTRRTSIPIRDVACRRR